MILPQIPPTLSNPSASWPSGKARLPECLGKREEEGTCWAGSLSSPYLPNAWLQQGNNLCLRVAPGVPHFGRLVGNTQL